MLQFFLFSKSSYNSNNKEPAGEILTKEYEKYLRLYNPNRIATSVILEKYFLLVSYMDT